MSLRRGRRWLAGASVSAFCVLGVVGSFEACAVYDGSLLVAAPITASDASVDVTTDVKPGPTCASAKEPAKPAVEDTTPDTNVTVAFAVHTVALGVKSTPVATKGFDLDLTCSCPGPQTCVRPAGTQPACDDAEGRDNRLQGVLQRFVEFDLEDLFNDRAKGGRGTVLISLSRYNGGQNDRALNVAAYISHGTEGYRLPGDAGRVDPTFTGTDAWTVHPDSIVGGQDALAAGATCSGASSSCSPVFVDTAAYVVGGLLVAHLEHMPTENAKALVNTTFDFDHAVLVARIHKDEAGVYHLSEGQVAGRWRTDKALRGIRGIENPFIPGGICKGTEIYKALKSEICSSADLAEEPKRDNQGQACTSISASIGFEAVQATLGKVFVRTDKPPCSEEEDSCATP